MIIKLYSDYLPGILPGIVVQGCQSSREQRSLSKENLAYFEVLYAKRMTFLTVNLMI